MVLFYRRPVNWGPELQKFNVPFSRLSHLVSEYFPGKQLEAISQDSAQLYDKSL